MSYLQSQRTISGFEQCEHRLSCGVCKETGKMCPHVFDNTAQRYQDELKQYLKDYYTLEIPNCCKSCPNHPSNEGSGICNCTAPYFEQSNKTVSNELTTSQTDVNFHYTINT